MLLAKSSLIEALAAPLDYRLIVNPILDESQIGPGSIDLRLGTDFIEVKRLAQETIDPMGEDPETLRRRQEKTIIPFGEWLTLHPGQFVLGSTFEFLRLPVCLAGQVLGRSSWGRLGLLVATAVFVQPGYAGTLTLELVNMGSVPVRLYPGLRIAQLIIWKVEGNGDYRADRPKYDSPLGPESSKAGWEREELDHIKRVGNRMWGIPLSP